MHSRVLHRSCTIIKRGELYRAHKAMVAQLKHDSFVVPAQTHCMSAYVSSNYTCTTAYAMQILELM